MTTYPYPLHRHLVRRADAGGSPGPRRLVLRDDAGREVSGDLPLADGPVSVELRWKPGTRDPDQLVGVFELFLDRMLAEGYATRAGDAAARVRFHRGEGGVIQLLSSGDGTAIALGTVDLAD